MDQVGTETEEEKGNKSESVMEETAEWQWHVVENRKQKSKEKHISGTQGVINRRYQKKN